MASQLLTSVEAGRVDVLRATAASDNPEDALQALSEDELARLWHALLPLVDQALEDAEPAMSGKQDGSSSPSEGGASAEALETLHAVTILAHACIADPERAAPDELVDLAASLHDIIFDLSDPKASALQAAIVDLCEAWWLSERAGRDELVPQCVSYMLVRALHDLASTADVKRLYSFRSSLTVLDYADESVAPPKRLLLHATIRPLVLRCAEGRKLIAYFFSLHLPFVAELHRAIKAQVTKRPSLSAPPSAALPCARASHAHVSPPVLSVRSSRHAASLSVRLTARSTSVRGAPPLPPHTPPRSRRTACRT